MFAKSLIVVGAFGAALLAGSVPSNAQGIYVDTPFVQFGVGSPWRGGPDYYGHYADRGAYAYSPRHRHYRGPRSYPNRYERPFLRWDPNGARWD